MRELKSGMPQLDPCCFPLLMPRGTPGWKWFMRKNGRMEYWEVEVFKRFLNFNFGINLGNRTNAK